LNKMKLAIVYGAICGGCDVALANWGERLIDISNKYDIIYWNAAVDAKNDLLESVREIDIGIYMGIIRTDYHLELIKTLREKTRILVAYGTCSVYGDIPGLSALIKSSRLLNDIKNTVTTTHYSEENISSSISLPRLLDSVYTVIQVVNPDIIVPGCPPSEESNDELINILLKIEPGYKPGGVIVLGEDRSLCYICPRKPEDFHRIVMPGIYRLHEVKLDERKCFLEQGVICLGPATRAACKTPCIKNNFPCTGCMGPAPGVEDTGLKLISSISSILLVDREKELLEKGLAKQLDKIVDPMGLFYRYTLPVSLVKKISEKERFGK